MLPEEVDPSKKDILGLLNALIEQSVIARVDIKLLSLPRSLLPLSNASLPNSLKCFRVCYVLRLFIVAALCLQITGW